MGREIEYTHAVLVQYPCGCVDLVRQPPGLVTTLHFCTPDCPAFYKLRVNATFQARAKMERL